MTEPVRRDSPSGRNDPAVLSTAERVLGGAERSRGYAHGYSTPEIPRRLGERWGRSSGSPDDVRRPPNSFLLRRRRGSLASTASPSRYRVLATFDWSASSRLSVPPSSALQKNILTRSRPAEVLEYLPEVCKKYFPAPLESEASVSRLIPFPDLSTPRDL